ncbi:MAG: Ig-like domain repeat protein [Gammaproteobacteria bacterium]
MLSRHLSSALAFFALMLFGISALAQAPKPSSFEATSGLSASAHLARAYGKLALSFQPNLGQTSKQVQWLARGSDYTLFLAGNDAVLEMYRITPAKPGQAPKNSEGVLRMNLLGANRAQKMSGAEPQQGKANYFTGNDSSHWQKNIPLYGQVRLDHVYAGVNLLYHGGRGQLEYDFIVAPNADPNRIALGFQGATPSIAANGDLLLPIPGDTTVRFDKPVAYQMAKDERTPVDAAYELASNGHVSFRLGAYDHSRELVIDPTLVFLGTLGAGDYPNATNLGQITVDSTGAMYFIGTTNDPTYPVTSGAYQQVCGPANSVAASNGIVYCGNSTSAYVSKISADGTKLVYSTYLSGGGGHEQGTSIAVDGSGVAYLLGATSSNDFPVTADAFQTQCQPRSAGVFGPPVLPPVSICDSFSNGGGTEYTVQGPEFFFAKLSADGSSLLYSSFLGGSYAAYPIATALDASGNWYLFGQTSVEQASEVYPGPGDTSTFVQFPGVSASGYQTVSNAKRNNPPSNSPEDIAIAGVLSKFSNNGHTLLYGTFFGDETYGDNVLPTSLAVGANSVAFIGGWSNASALPTTPGAAKGSCTAVASSIDTCTTVDGFVAAFDTTKSGAASLVYSTRIGGSATSQGSNIPNQEVLGVAADSNNDAYVTGYTYDQTFPVPTTAYMNACATVNPANTNNCNSAFVLEINPAGTAILGGSFLSGTAAYAENSVGYEVLLDSKNQVYLYGISQDGQRTFPTVNPVQAQGNGGNALYIATMTSDLTKLLFSTRFGNPNLNGSNVTPVNGLALDPSGNIYFAGTTYDQVFTATTGTYATAANSGTAAHTFFGKISPVLLASITSLSVSPETTATFGSSITFTATVTGSSSTAPTGTVTFLDGTTTLGPGTLSSGKATYATSALAVGAHSITAAYSGDSSYDVSTSAAVSVTVAAAPAPTVTISVSPTSITVGQSATITWSSTNATACTASSAWSGTQATSGMLTVTPTAAGSLSYAFACTGSGGTANGSAKLTVNAAAPGGGSGGSSSGSGGGGGAMNVWMLLMLAALALARLLGVSSPSSRYEE